ncbi:hypothetical protein [Haloarcula sp. H-GB5]
MSNQRQHKLVSRLQFRSLIEQITTSRHSQRRFISVAAPVVPVERHS